MDLILIPSPVCTPFIQLHFSPRSSLSELSISVQFVQKEIGRFKIKFCHSVAFYGWLLFGIVFIFQYFVVSDEPLSL